MRFEFSSAEFRPVASNERISKCRAMAEGAEMLAYSGASETQEGSLLLARQWRDLAAEIARAHLAPMNNGAA